MHDFMKSLNLQDIQNFLLSGHPSILFQILAVNTIVMMIYIFRQGRNSGMRSHVTYVVQWILIIGNLMVACEEQWMPYWTQGSSAVFQKYNQVIRPY